jgi:hypothetical protein
VPIGCHELVPIGYHVASNFNVRRLESDYIIQRYTPKKIIAKSNDLSKIIPL